MSVRVQVSVPTLQLHPEPLMAVTLNPDGGFSMTLTVPEVGAVPLLVAVRL